MNGQQVWGGKVAGYLFASGLGAGAYAVGAVAQQAGAPASASAAALSLGPLVVGPAALLLVWDLGRPAGFLRAARRPGSSWISRGVGILSAFVVVSAVHAAMTLASPAGPPGPGRLALAVPGLLLALLTMLYTGLLLGAIRPIPFWSTPILPLLFLVSGLSTGAMTVDLVLTLGHAAAGSAAPAMLAALRGADLALLVIEALVLALYLSACHATAAARNAVALLMSGALATRFWGGVGLAGIALPVAVQTAEVTGALPEGLAWVVLSSGAGLAGGLLLRVVVIAAGVKSPLSAAGHVFPAPGRAPVWRP